MPMRALFLYTSQLWWYAEITFVQQYTYIRIPSGNILKVTSF